MLEFSNLDDGWSLSSPSRKPGERNVLLVGGVECAFRYCPEGSFVMGSLSKEEGRSDDERLHKVNISSFWMQETPITQKMWRGVTGNNPSEFNGSELLPVDSVSWDDCVDFLDMLNCYGAVPNCRFALPTESQWEYACRAKTSTPFWWGGVLKGDMANCDGRVPYGTDEKGPYLECPTVVGSYPANPWGLYDMHGNVWEWCEDWYGAYPKGETFDPKGPDDGNGRVQRGGGWGDGGLGCRSASRFFFPPDVRHNLVGARLVIVPDN